MQDFFLILLPGVCVGWLASRIGQPAAVAQVLLGLVIGPPLLGWIDSGEALELIGQPGIVLLLGMAGMHIGFRHLAQQGWTALWVAMHGILLCLAGLGCFQGHISHHVLVALILVAIGTAVVSPLVMARMARLAQ